MADFSNYTDHQLANLLRLGDEHAFKEIYDRYWRKLFFVAAKRLNDAYEAEEVLQDIFLNLWKKKDAFELKIGFDNYLAVAVKFEVLKKRASRARQEQMIAGLAIVNEGALQYDQDTYDYNALQDQLDFTINTLPTKCKLVFTMSRKDALPNKKIAELLNVSEKTVEKHITHALKVLKARLGVEVIVLLIIKGLI